MDKAEIVAALEEIAVLLELKGENAFKVRAYQNGARALEGLAEDLGTVIAEERLGKVPGVGKALVDKVTQLHRTGALPYLTNLRAEVPAGLVEMTDVPGLGPKKIRKLHLELGLESLDALAAAAKDGRVAGLAGFGAKSAEKIVAGIAQREAYGRRHLWWSAARVARPLVEGLRALPEVQRAEAAGSFRRGKETVGDLDFIVAADEPEPVMAWFTSHADVKEVTAQGSTKSSVRFSDGLQADLRVVPPEQFVFALHHFTGSKDHNVAMRQRALARGLSLSEWGLFPAESRDDDVPLRDRPQAFPEITEEAELFAKLDLAFVPPELREGWGEIEAAEAGPFPRLVEVGDLTGVFHNHTTASDGRATLEEMAAAAAARGWSYLGIADHSKSSFQAHGLDLERLKAQVAEIRAYNARADRALRIYAGSEVDILRDGSLDFSADEMAEADLDYVVLSVHAALTGLSEAEMTDRLVKAIEMPLPVRKILGHPTGRLLLRREGYAVNLAAVIEAAAATGTVIELNAAPQRLELDWRWWPKAKAAGVLASINPDAHAPGQFDFVEPGVLTARKGQLTKEDVLNTQRPEVIQAWIEDGKK